MTQINSYKTFNNQYSKLQVKPQKSSDSGLAFFFLILYTITVLIRPHEIFVTSEKWILVQIFAIFCFIFSLVGIRPLKIELQHIFLILLLPQIVLSGFLNGWGSGGIVQAQKLLISSIIPLFMYTSCITSITKQHVLIWISLAAALCMIHNGHVQQASPDGIGWAGTKTVGIENRITYLGFFNDPNDLGMFLLMNIPFACYFYITGGFLKKVTMVFILVAILYGIYMTNSRGTLVSTIGLIGCYYLLTKGKTKTIILGLVSLPVMGIILSSFRGISTDEDSALGRLDAWYDGIMMLVHNPVFGIGMGNFRDWHGKVAHNSYVQIAAELGIVGYSLWSLALILTMYFLFQAQKSIKSGENNQNTNQDVIKKELILGKALFYSLVGFALTGYFLTRTYTLTLFIYLGMALASQRRLISIDQNFSKYLGLDYIKNAFFFSWLIIILIYMTLKLTL